MGTKVRAVGADSVLRGVSEVASTYGVSPTTGYKKLHFKSLELDSERLLGYDALLGQGRDAADPFYEAINVNGDVGVPIDVRALGFWLHGLFGTDTKTDRAATGGFTFSANPVTTNTIGIGAAGNWTFVTSGATANQSNLGVTLRETLKNLVVKLNAHASSPYNTVTYTADDTKLYIQHKTGGAGGNSFTTTAGTAPAVPFNATLLGGSASYSQHTFKSGLALPSKTLEVGHPELATAQFFRFAGCKFGTFAFDLARTGPANATVNVIAQGRVSAGTTIDAAATPYSLSRFSHGSGGVYLNGFQVAAITGGSVEYSNTLEAIETIRGDGLIDGVDEGEAACTGTVMVRYGTDTAISDAAAAQTPVSMQYGFTLPSADSFLHRFEIFLPRVFLPKAKLPIPGPGGIEQTLDWRAAKSTAAAPNDYLAQVTLINDENSAYA